MLGGDGGGDMDGDGRAADGHSSNGLNRERRSAHGGRSERRRAVDAAVPWLCCGVQWEAPVLVLVT